MNRPSSIQKMLSRNDTGETGAHQAGFLVPRDPTILSFFPSLDSQQKNPRHHLAFCDDVGERWEFAFIYYNNKYFGGTRDEYRLTRMTSFLRARNLCAGDTVVLTRSEQGYRITCRKADPAEATAKAAGGAARLKLRHGWKIVSI